MSVFHARETKGRGLSEDQEKNLAHVVKDSFAESLQVSVVRLYGTGSSNPRRLDSGT